MPSANAIPKPPASNGHGRLYRGASMDARKAERRAKFLRAGLEVFGSQGFQAATVRQICAAAGLTERYFYESFENLLALFSEVYDHELERLRQIIMRVLTTSPRSVETMAESAMQAYFKTMKAEPHMARVLLIEIYGTTQDMTRLYRRGVQDFAELIRGIIESSFRVDPKSHVDPGMLSTAIVGGVIHLGIGWYLSGYKAPIETMVASSVAVMSSLMDKFSKLKTLPPGG